MNHLIKITEKDGRQVVSARDLHQFLASKKQFADWIEHRINKYGLVENQDYVTFSLNGEKGRPSVEYALSLDAAKELSMVEGNAKGKEARQYFIECERIAKQPQQISHKRALQIALEQVERAEMAEEQVRLLTETVKQQAPKVEYVETVLQAVNTWPITLIAAELGKSAIALNQILKEKGIHRKVNGVWVLNADYCNKGYTGTRTHNYTDTLGRPCTSQLTVWTEKGREFIHGLVNEKLNKQLTHA